MNNLINRYKTLLLLSIIVMGLTSCEKEIDVDLKSASPRIVIEGTVKQNQYATVCVSSTIDFGNNEGYPNLSGAVVTVSDDKGNSEQLKQDKNGWYTAEKIKGEVGRIYNMTVVYDGQEYKATSQMPPQVPLDSVTMSKKIPVMDYTFPVINFQDPVGETNQYYRFLLFINGKQLPDIEEFVLSADLVDGEYFRQDWIVYRNGSDEDPYEKGDELTIEFQCIDKGTYKFFNSMRPIGQSPTNAISNISNGALGYFSACTSEKKTIIADWED